MTDADVLHTQHEAAGDLRDREHQRLLDLTSGMSFPRY